jgi:hypothetical protein
MASAFRVTLSRLPLPREIDTMNARRLLVACLLTIGFAFGAAALEAPKGKVVLSVSGRISIFNAAQRADFDMAMLRALPQQSFSTSTPWYSGKHKFTGPLIKDLLAAVGGSGTVLKTLALNDYKVDIPIEDLISHGAILAHAFDDKEMSIRDKGPLFIVFPYDSSPDLQTERFFNRSPWQLRRIEVR